LFLKSFTQGPNVLKLREFLEKRYPGAEYICAYEAGFSGYWIAEQCKVQGIKCLVVNPADIPRSHKDRSNKNDDRDSKSIAMQLRAGSLREIWIPDEELRADRGLLRARKQIVKDTVRMKNRIHAFLKFNGISIPEGMNSSNWPKRFVKWLEELNLAHGGSRETLNRYLSTLQNYRVEQAKVVRELRLRAKTKRYNDVVELLKTIHGISWLSAITFVLELGSIKRFPKFDNLASYVGLVPGEHSSGERKRATRITRRCNRYLRELLIEDAWVAVRYDQELQRYFTNKCKSFESSEAIIYVAQRLLRRIRSVWLHGTPYKVILTTGSVRISSAQVAVE
jgi:transposase